MNGSGKPSFYEIQLSNGSLIVAFLVAVTLGVAVFMLGVAVGRGQAPQDVIDDDWVQPSPGESSGAEELPGTDDEFFSQVLEPTEDGATPPVAGPETQPAGEEISPPVAEQLPPHDASLALGWVVQVKAVPDRDVAAALQEALELDGFPTFVVSADVAGTITYRVRVGRYGDESAAQRVALALSRRSDIDETWITEG